MVAVIRGCDKYAHDLGNIMAKNNAKMTVITTTMMTTLMTKTPTTMATNAYNGNNEDVDNDNNKYYDAD